MRPLLFVLFFVSLLGCAESTTREMPDAASSDAASPDAAVGSDADVVCTSIARPTGSCDPSRGVCCTDSVCLSGFCRSPGWMCSGDLEHCVHRDDCCNSRHSCIDNACQY